MGEPVFEPTAPMSNWIGVAKHRFHPDLTARTDLDGTTRHVVGPQIEGAAARQREARMMPVAGQDAILDTAPFERETHMGAAIVERKDVTALLHEEDRAVTAMHDEPPFGLQFIEAAGGHGLTAIVFGRRAYQRVSVRQFGKQQEAQDPGEDETAVVDWRYRHQLARGKGAHLAKLADRAQRADQSE